MSHFTSVVLAVAVAAGCGNPTMDSAPPAKKAEINQIESIEDFQDALAAERAILFVDSRKSVRIQLTKRAFLRFVEDCRNPVGTPAVAFYMVDFTDPEGPLWDTVQEWMHANGIPDGGLKSWGCTGKIVWMEEGAARDYMWSREDLKADEIAETTQKAFQGADDR